MYAGQTKKNAMQGLVRDIPVKGQTLICQSSSRKEEDMLMVSVDRTMSSHCYGSIVSQYISDIMKWLLCTSKFVFNSLYMSISGLTVLLL